MTEHNIENIKEEQQMQLTETELEKVVGGRMPWDVPRPRPRIRRKPEEKKDDDDIPVTT